MYNELKEEYIHLKMTYTRKVVMKLISVVVSNVPNIYFVWSIISYFCIFKYIF
jgi:hypothetical protein